MKGLRQGIWLMDGCGCGSGCDLGLSAWPRCDV